MHFIDYAILGVIALIFALIIRSAYKAHKRGIPIDCISCSFAEDAAYNHEACTHHTQFDAKEIEKVKAELHAKFNQS